MYGIQFPTDPMMDHFLSCVCVCMQQCRHVSTMYRVVSSRLLPKTLMAPMSRQVWEAVAPPEGAILEDNSVVVSAEGDCNANMAGRAEPQPMIQ